MSDEDPFAWCERYGRGRGMFVDRAVCFHAHLIMNEDVEPGSRDEVLQNACLACPQYRGLVFTMDADRRKMMARKRTVTKNPAKESLAKLADAANAVIEAVEELQELWEVDGASDAEPAEEETPPARRGRKVAPISASEADDEEDDEEEEPAPAPVRRKKRPAPVEPDPEPEDDAEDEDDEDDDAQDTAGIEDIDGMTRMDLLPIAEQHGVATRGVPVQALREAVKEAMGGANRKLNGGGKPGAASPKHRARPVPGKGERRRVELN